jgi:hypothetical protein
LDQFDSEAHAWEEILVEDRHAGPAETAITRIDFATWLQLLPRRLRKIATFLANGETTGTAAKKFRMSKGRISQIRKELFLAWVWMAGIMATKASCQAGGDFLQRIGFADVFMGDDLQEVKPPPSGGGHVGKHSHPSNTRGCLERNPRITIPRHAAWDAQRKRPQGGRTSSPPGATTTPNALSAVLARPAAASPPVAAGHAAIAWPASGRHNPGTAEAVSAIGAQNLRWFAWA